MLNARQIHILYNKLYAEMRNYIWDFEVVENLANLEIDCYKALPDIKTITNDLHKLESNIRDILHTDDQLKAAFDKLFNYIDSDNEIYIKLDKVREVVNL